MKITDKFFAVLFCFSLLFVTNLNAQNTEYLEKSLFKASSTYAKLLYKKHKVKRASKYWNSSVYDRLRAGYNNRKIVYNTNDDLLFLFEKDFKIFLKSVNINSLKMTEKSEFIKGDNNDIYAFIEYELLTTSHINVSSLKTVILDLVTFDNGKTWKIQRDGWIQNFMHYLHER